MSRRLVAGIGCSTGCSGREIITLIEMALASAGLAADELAAIATLDRKLAEPGIKQAGEHFGVPLLLFNAEQLAEEAGKVTSLSGFTRDAVGTGSVAEAAALKSGPLLVPKQRSLHATCAIAELVP